MSFDFLLIIFVVLGAVGGYAAGYFHERKVPDPPERDPDLPDGADESLRRLMNAYSAEVLHKYRRNHARRRADKFLREFWLATVHFIIFIALAVAAALIDQFRYSLIALEILVGLTYLTLALKAGQLTAAKETTERKEQIFIHAVELVNEARANMMMHADADGWVKAMSVRDEKSPMHY